MRKHCTVRVGVCAKVASVGLVVGSEWMKDFPFNLRETARWTFEELSFFKRDDTSSERNV